MKTFAINICLTPSQPTYDICCELNKLDTSDYNLNSREYVPHVTLVMKNITPNMLKDLIHHIQELSIINVESIREEYSYEKFDDIYWSAMLIKKNDVIRNIQNQITKITEKYKNQPLEKDNYAVDNFFAEDISAGLINEKLFRAQESSHITLGHQDIETEYNKLLLPREITFDKLVIGQMGNYGSVRKILFEKNLT